MGLGAALVALAVVVLVGSAVAERIAVPPPLLLIALGVGASFIPSMPTISLSPEIVLVGFLPPLLYATAMRTSLVDFKANRGTILALSVGLVAFTTVGVGVVVHYLLPGLPWWAAFAIGAVVAPPDAVAASAVARRIGLPRRVVTILEGESLLNDATALVSLRTAIAAGVGVITASQAGLDFVVAAGGGVLVGVLLFLVVGWVRTRVTDPIVDTGISFVVPFAAWLAAEEISASGVIAVVVAGALLGHRAPLIQTAAARVTEQVNWRTIGFVLENAVFLLIGLQARTLLAGVGSSDIGARQVVVVCLGAFVTVVVLRLVWVFPARYLLARPGPDHTGKPPPASYTFLVGWAGMRGVVTLAAAFVIPADTPYRETLLMIAFTVVAGTLFVQGLTLPWVARLLKVGAPDPADDALARATVLQEASRAGLRALNRLDEPDPHGVFDFIRQQVDQRTFAAWEQLSTSGDSQSPSKLYTTARRAMIQAERAKVLQIRGTGRIDSEIVTEVLALLDVEESMLDSAIFAREETPTSTARSVVPAGEDCPDLLAFPVVDAAPARACRRCLDEGTQWVALRRCLVCGHVGCCDSSPARHATAHFELTGHPVIQSAEPGETWRWCYVHHLTG